MPLNDDDFYRVGNNIVNAIDELESQQEIKAVLNTLQINDSMLLARKQHEQYRTGPYIPSAVVLIRAHITEINKASSEQKIELISLMLEFLTIIEDKTKKFEIDQDASKNFFFPDLLNINRIMQAEIPSLKKMLTGAEEEQRQLEEQHQLEEQCKKEAELKQLKKIKKREELIIYCGRRLDQVL